MKKQVLSAPLRQSLSAISAEVPKRISRRAFLQSVAAFAAGRAFAAPPGVFSVGTPLLSFAAISDIHVTVQKPSLKYGTKVFEHALEWYRAQGVDAVVITGDLADKGLTEELEMVGAAWRKVFPENKGSMMPGTMERSPRNCTPIRRISRRTNSPVTIPNAGSRLSANGTPPSA